MTVVLYTRVDIAGRPRIKIDSPIQCKDAIKATGVARAEYKGSGQNKKFAFWSLPWTSMSYHACAGHIDLRLGKGVVDHRPDDFVADLASIPRVRSQVINDYDRDFCDTTYAPDPHQRLGSAMLARMGGSILWWDMGARKTKTVLDAIVQYDLKRTLIIAPSPLIHRVWIREYYKHVTPGNRQQIEALFLDSGSVQKRAQQIHSAMSRRSAGRKVLVVINYETLYYDPMRNELVNWQWDLAACDESHRIGGPNTKACKYLVTYLQPFCRHRAALTGTLMSDGPVDAFGQCLWVEPGLFGVWITSFRERFCKFGGFQGKQVIGYQNEDRFRKRLELVTSRVRLEDVVKLPEPQYLEYPVTMNKDARKAYAEMRDDFITAHGDAKSAATNGLTKMIRMQQITSGFLPYEREDGTEIVIDLDTAKKDALIDLFNSTDSHEPWVVFARFTKDLASIHTAALECDRPSFELSGGTDDLDNWEAECDLGRGAVAVVQIQAGAEGGDYTRARYQAYFSLTYSFREYHQSTGRLQRPGQKRVVMGYHLIVPGTVDRSIFRVLDRRRKRIKNIESDIPSDFRVAEEIAEDLLNMDESL